MGTHPTLPSRLLTGGGETLGEHLRKNPELLGARDLDDLPFLFKVLAIRKALSIQSHPDKQFAEKLHAIAPNLYKGIPLEPFQIKLIKFCCTYKVDRPEPQTRNGHRLDAIPGHVRLQRAARDPEARIGYISGAIRFRGRLCRPRIRRQPLDGYVEALLREHHEGRRGTGQGRD